MRRNRSGNPEPRQPRLPALPRGPTRPARQPSGPRPVILPPASRPRADAQGLGRLLAAVVLDPGHPLGVDLQAAGLPGEVRMAGVLAASALWAAREAAAAAALGSLTGSSSFTFGPLLERLARTLA